MNFANDPHISSIHGKFQMDFFALCYGVISILIYYIQPLTNPPKSSIMVRVSNYIPFHPTNTNKAKKPTISEYIHTAVNTRGDR
jgi:hypothetical protein